MAGLTPTAFDERDVIVNFLRQQRYVLKVAAFNLTDEQATESPSVSALSVGGVIKHVALTERHWIKRIVLGEEYGNPEDEYENGFTFVGDETLASVLAFYD